MSTGPWRRQYCIQILLPLRHGDGRPVERAELEEVKATLAERYGGVTAYLQSPAEGLWDNGAGREADRVVVIEVMAEALDGGAWTEFQAELERRFQQEEVVVRAQTIERLGR